jgi:hypothetical protein
MSLQLVPATDEHVVATLAGDDKIVRHEAVAPFDEIEDALRLADATRAGEEKSDTEDIGK